MVLAEGIEDADGVRHAMTGLLGHFDQLRQRKLHLGYREARLLADNPIGAAGSVVRGHEFHYATVLAAGPTNLWQSLRMPKGNRSAAMAAGADASAARSSTRSRARPELAYAPREIRSNAICWRRPPARTWPYRCGRRARRAAPARPRRTRALTETHAEIEQRRELELAQQHPMRRLGRDMRRQGMIERIAAQLRQRRDRRSADEAIEQHRDPALARRQRRAHDGGQFASRRAPPALASGSERRLRVVQVRGRSPTAFVPGRGRRHPCRGRPSARRRRRTAPRRPPRPPWYSRFPSRRDKRGPSRRDHLVSDATAVRNAASSIAGACVKSAVGCSSASGTTCSLAPAVRASWLIAAPPAAKFATICVVTSAG
jgi:hypothetical protein